MGLQVSHQAGPSDWPFSCPEPSTPGPQTGAPPVSPRQARLQEAPPSNAACASQAASADGESVSTNHRGHAIQPVPVHTHSEVRVINTSWSGQRRSFPSAIRKQIMDRDKWRCQIKGPTCLGKATQADHRINHAEGGSDDASNGQAVCGPCHDAKTRQERMRGRARHSRKRQPQGHPGLR